MGRGNAPMLLVEHRTPKGGSFFNPIIADNGKAMTNSLLVAQGFGKQHKDVLETVRNLTSAEFSADLSQMFAEVELPDAYGRLQPAYIMNRDGFSLLVMGFTGKRAMQFKIDFINAFNQMEDKLRAPQPALDFSNPDTVLMLAQNWKEEQAKRIAAEAEQERLTIANELANETIKTQAPKVKAFEDMISSEGLININKIAMEHGMSAIKMNRILCQRGVQYKQGDCYILYAKYKDRDLATLRANPYLDSTGNQRSRMHLYWTQAGRVFIHELLSDLKRVAI